MRLAIVAGLLLLQPCSASAQQQAPLELAPTSPWAMNYDADSCALQRQFGAEGQEVFFEIRQFGPDVVPQMVVASRQLALGRGDTEVTILPIDGQSVEVDAYAVDMDEGYVGRMFERELLVDNAEEQALLADFSAGWPGLDENQRERLLLARTMAQRWRDTQGNAREVAARGYTNVVRSEAYRSIPRKFFQDLRRQDSYRALMAEQAGRVTAVLVEHGFERPVLLRTGSLAAPLRAMNTCLDELMLHWGIDVEAHRHLTRAAQPLDYDRLAREIVDNYPREMLSQRQQAYIRVRLAVSPEGTTTACNLQNDYNETTFERTVCEAMFEYARFEPALDAAGQPIASYYQINVVFRLG
ncbi:MAG: energy transducer TonB [Alteraurantiacibacter sp.]